MLDNHYRLLVVAVRNKETNLQNSWTTQRSQSVPAWSAARGTWSLSGRRLAGSGECWPAAWLWYTPASPRPTESQSSSPATRGSTGECVRRHALCRTGRCSAPAPRCANNTGVSLLHITSSTVQLPVLMVAIRVCSKLLYRPFILSDVCQSTVLEHTFRLSYRHCY